jgi:hypothetical protein
MVVGIGVGMEGFRSTNLRGMEGRGSDWRRRVVLVCASHERAVA